MKTIFAGIVVLIFLSGCSTKYQPESFTGGYSETRLSENVFSVSFKGNKYTSMEKVSDFILLRSSELALENSYKFFSIENSEQRNSIHTTESSYTTSGYINGSNFTGYTNQTGGTIYLKPGRNNTIVCYKEKPQINGIVYDAEYVKNSIRKKYSVE